MKPRLWLRLAIARALLRLRSPRLALRFSQPRPGKSYCACRGQLVDQALDDLDRQSYESEEKGGRRDGNR
jgi:hypothetical protein